MTELRQGHAPAIHGGRVNAATLVPMDNGTAIQTVGHQYATAVRVQLPRDLVKVEEKCLVEAGLAGDSIYYGWNAGGSQIEGPSVEAAMILLRNYGNAALVQQPMIETEKAFVFTSAFIDLETGVTYQRQFRQSKESKVSFKTDDARQDEIRFQIGQSKSDRNVVLRVLPGWLASKMIERAKEGIRAKIADWIKAKGIAHARDRIEAELAKYGVDEPRIIAKYGKAKSKWDADSLTLLSGDLKALQSGYDTPEAIFPLPTVDVSSVRLSGGLDPAGMRLADSGYHQDHDGRPDEKPDVHGNRLSTDPDHYPDENQKPEQKAEPTAPKVSRKNLLAEIKKLESDKGLTDLERGAIKSGAGITNLSRSTYDQLLKYRDSMTQCLAKAKGAAQAKPEAPADEDNDDLIEEVVRLEKTCKLDDEGLSKLGSDRGIPEDLGDCSRAQLKIYRDALKANQKSPKPGAEPLFSNSPAVTLADVKELERQYSVEVTATDIQPMRDSFAGGDIEFASPEQLNVLAENLAARLESARAAKAGAVE